MALISDLEKIIYRSHTPQDLYCYTPCLSHGFDGRLLLSFDIAGRALPREPGPKSDHGDYGSNQCRIFVSDDHGESWRQTGALPLLHARVFKAGKALYTLGHSGRMLISRSADNGDTWSTPAVLEDTHHWHQSAGTVDYRHGNVYLTMEHVPFADHWAGGDPVLMRAAETADLTDPANWTFSNVLRFEQAVPKTPNLFGIQPSCWLESSVLRIYDPAHAFYDPADRTVLLLMRIAGTRINNYAALAVGREAADGSLTLDTLKQADGTPLLYLPFPGGYMKFQILYDEVDRRYWSIASRAVWSSLRRPGALPKSWFGERQRLELFHSTNLIDWCSAGVVAVGPCDSGSRHYASVLADGDDLLVLSRSGDEQAKNSHDTNLITLHRVNGFRALARD